jgi:hypothetical protein
MGFLLEESRTLGANAAHWVKQRQKDRDSQVDRDCVLRPIGRFAEGRDVYSLVEAQVTNRHRSGVDFCAVPPDGYSRLVESQRLCAISSNLSRFLRGALGSPGCLPGCSLS